MKCKRCGGDEYRIKGFCSIACQEYWYYEEEIKELKAGNKAIGSWLSAALDDDLACDEFKADIKFWFEQQELS